MPATKKFRPGGMTYDRAFEIACAVVDAQRAEAVDLDAQIRALHADGLVDSAIALQVGYSRHTVGLRRRALHLLQNDPRRPSRPLHDGKEPK